MLNVVVTRLIQSPEGEPKACHLLKLSQITSPPVATLSPPVSPSTMHSDFGIAYISTAVHGYRDYRIGLEMLHAAST